MRAGRRVAGRGIRGCCRPWPSRLTVVYGRRGAVAEVDGVVDRAVAALPRADADEAQLGVEDVRPVLGRVHVGRVEGVGVVAGLADVLGELGRVAAAAPRPQPRSARGCAAAGRGWPSSASTAGEVLGTGRDGQRVQSPRGAVVVHQAEQPVLERRQVYDAPTRRVRRAGRHRAAEQRASGRQNEQCHEPPPNRQGKSGQDRSQRQPLTGRDGPQRKATLPTRCHTVPV